MKKAIILLFSLLGISLNTIAQTIDINNIRYSLKGASAIVSEYLGGEGICVVPSTIYYNGLDYTVTTIGIEAFSSKNVTEVKLPETITTIETKAFWYCQKLTKINLPHSLKSIGTWAFCNCTSLTQLIIPEKVNFIFLPHYSKDSPFKFCNTLRILFYLGEQAPNDWTATTYTYIPDVQSYSTPTFRMNDAHVIEMISFDKNSFIYTGQSPTTTWTNNVEGYTVSLTMPTLKKDVGIYKEVIPATFTKDNESFTANIVYHYTINPVNLTAKVNNINREYGNENPSFSCSYSGFVNGENEDVIITEPIISTTATNTSNVGEYPITASGGSAKNYTFVSEPGTLTITKTPLTAKVNNETRQYGKDNPRFTISYTGLKNGETVPAWTTAPTFQTEATKASGVGEYAIKAVNGVPVNYDLEIADGTLSITPAPLTIKANDATRPYYSNDPAFSYKCNGFVNGDDESVLISPPILSTTATRNSNVGTYEIRAGEASCSNYSISYINGTLTITPCTLTASVGNYERIYNEENPVFEVKYDGFVGNEDESVLNSQAIANTTATKTSDVGTYKITVSGGSAANYTFSYVSGILTINKAEQTISWGQNLAKLKVGDQIELKATASSGLTVTYSSENPSIAEVYAVGNKYYLDCKGEGELWLVAVQDGNHNYYSSPRIRKNIVIGDASGINVNTRTIARIEKTTTGIRVIDTIKGEMVYVYTSGGQMIYSVKAVDHIIDIPLAKEGVYIVKVAGKTVKLGF